MRTILKDIHFGARVLFRNAGFTAVAVLSLALGVGANTSVFSVVNAVLLRPLPFREPDRIVKAQLTDKTPRGEAIEIPYWSYPKFRAVRERVRTLDDMAAFASLEMTLRGAAMPERVNVEIVSAAYFPLLGTRAFMGRTFAPEEDGRPGAHPVALLGHGLWQRRFGSDRNVIGRKVLLGNAALIVIGVLPPGFRGLSGTAEIWAPVAMAPALFNIPDRLEQVNAHWLQAAARIRHGAALDQARADIAGAALGAASAIPGMRAGAPWSARVDLLAETNVDPRLRSLLFVLSGAVGFVLLIACANMAGLMLARAAAREQEMAIRVALGAGRLRVVRQLLAESGLLGLLGGLAGLVLALWAVDALSVFKPGNAFSIGNRVLEVPGFNPVRIDGRVLSYNFVIAVLAAVLFGLLPAWKASSPSLVASLKEGAARWGRGRLAGLNPRAVLVSAEVALALVLLTGAGLMGNSLVRLLRTPVGFDARHVISCRVEHPDPAAAPAFWDAVTARAEALPGVQSVGYASAAPLSGMVETSFVEALDGASRNGERHVTGIHIVSAGLFQTLHIPLRRGRGFTEQDRAGMPPVIVLNETAAHKLFPGEDPIGRRVSLAAWSDALASLEVIGVVGNVRYGSVEEPFSAQVYLSLPQMPVPFGYLFLRADGDPAALAAALRREAAAVDRNVPVYDVRTMSQRLAAVTSRPRFTATLLGLFAAAALALAAVGVYGVTAYAVSRRVREFGIRMALGAARHDVLRMVVRSGMLLTAAGVAAGLAGSLALTRFLASQLYGVRPNDPVTFAVTVAVIALTGLAATCIPAYRATRLDPIRSLRYE